MKEFYFHYSRTHEMMKVISSDGEYLVKDVVCNAPCQTKWIPGGDPKLVMHGEAEEIHLEDNKAIIV